MVPGLPPVPGLEGVPLPNLSSTSGANVGPITLGGTSFGHYGGANFTGAESTAGETIDGGPGWSGWLLVAGVVGGLFLLRGKL